MDHLTGPGTSGKLAHLPPSKSTLRLNQSIGSMFIVEVCAILYSAVFLDSGFMSKSYLSSAGRTRGSCARCACRAGPKASSTERRRKEEKVDDEVETQLVR